MQPESISIAQCLADDRVIIDLSVSSRKLLLQQLALILCRGDSTLSSDVVFKTLTDRERLGSTALGHGIAIPHGRIADLKQPLIALAKLKSPIEYDSPDGLPIWLAVSLLVPDDACADHLNLLAGLAIMMSDVEFVAELKSCTDHSILYTLFTQPEEPQNLVIHDQ